MTLGLPLPRFVVLQSRSPNNDKRNRYLRYSAEEGELNDVVSCNGDDATNPNAKFEVEQATNDGAFNRPMVHIRSCYNNKYLRPSSSSSDDDDECRLHCIVAVAEKPEEDQSQRSSTLFEPVFSSDDPNTIRLLHIQSGLYLRWSDDICTLAGSPIQNNNDEDIDDAEMFMFKVISWDSLVILPKYVAFRGDNGLYLAVRKVDNIDSPCLQFAASDEADDKSVKNQFIPAPDGRSVRIKNVRSGSFWKRDDYNWICPAGEEQSSSSEDDDAMLFQVIKIKDNVIALLNLGNNHFCKRYTVKAAESCLRAMDSTVTEFAHLEVVELVTSRSIYNIHFRLDHARIISSNRRKIVASTVAINSTDDPRAKNVELTFDDSKTMTWKNSSSLRLSSKMMKGVRIESEVAHVGTGPEIVMTTGEFGNDSYEWGETTTRTWRVKRVHKVVVPPTSKVTVRLWGTVGECEVPLSYVQRDVLGNGEVESYVRDDGFYCGTNFYDFDYEIMEDSLV